MTAPPDQNRVTRRQMLKAIAASSAAATSAAKAAHWSNWSNGQQANAANIVYARSEDDIVDTVKSAREVRAFGGSHSFSAVVPTNGTLISIDAMNGVISHDDATKTATMWAGTRLGQASYELAQRGQSMMNEPDINLQSIGGSISTAVHGTGRQLQCVSAYTTGLRLVLASGDIVNCSAVENSELFEAARVAVGTMGIITQATLQNTAFYKLKETVAVMSLDDAVAMLQQDKDKYRHIEFWGFIDGNEAIVKYHDIANDLPDTAAQTPLFDENRTLEFAVRTARRFPWLNRPIQEIVSLFVSDETRVGAAWQIFPSARTVPFNEMEYQVPVETGFACFEEIRTAMRKSGVQVFFPLEFRFVKADDVWLSPFYQRDSISISVHQFYEQDYRPLFEIVEPIFRKYDGRPHWGKLHTCKAQDLAAMYPRWQDFQRVRTQFDPTGKFLNAHMRDVFGIGT
jgi:FAD-linked oxidoreductase